MADAAVTPFDCEVLVVGAGPTGLIAANLLRRSGVDVRIVERRVEASRESRAFAVQARTLELMQSIGLSDEFLTRGVLTTGIDIHVRGKRRGGLDLDRANAGDTPFQFILMIPQSETEAILIADLERLGVTVERGVTVSGIAQDKSGVKTDVQFPNEATGTIHSQYIIGADGSRSIVRSESQLDFAGGSYEQSFLLADCKVEWPEDQPLGHQRFRVFVNRDLIGLFLPLEGSNISRVMTNDRDGYKGGIEDASKPAAVQLDAIEKVYAEATGLDVKLSDPVWVTNYYAHHRGVESYRAGRAFVAGDAAHIHSPAGGQGMNTGLQDAANLAWKLALVLRGHGGDMLLQDYDDERKAVGDLVVRSTGRLFKAAAGLAGKWASFRDWAVMALLPLVSYLPPFHWKAFFNISQRAIAYEQGQFVGEGPSWPKGGPRSGERAPDAAIDGDTTMFDVIGGYVFTLVGFSRAPLSPQEVTNWRAALERLSALVPNCRTELVARLAHGTDDTMRTATSGEVFDRYGFSDRAGQVDGLYLIRPDTYVAWRCAGRDEAAFAQFVQVFAPTAKQNMQEDITHG